jgi:predicted SAM-dependent methyltransferase
VIIKYSRDNKKLKFNKLNIGCGRVVFRDSSWLNVDMNDNSDLVDCNYMQLDITKSFPFKNIECIYSEHFIEHITKNDGIAFVRNSYKALVDSGVLRIATFDISKVIDTCHSSNKNWKEECRPDLAGLGKFSQCEYLNAVFRNWGHKFVYNELDLVDLFERGGFKDIQICESGKSTHQALNNRETRLQTNLVVEGIKN